MVHPSSRHGFTLVELAIVLVILGLLVGGVMAGQSLIHASRVRGVGEEITKYRVAIGAFRDKYLAIPGDMATATRYWGAQTGATTDGEVPACAALTAAATGIATCNGNGNGYISDAGNSANPHEMYRAWQHLKNAGLVDGTYTGVGYNSQLARALVGENVPRSKYPNAGWNFMSFGNYAGNVNTYPGKYGNIMILGSDYAGNTPAYNPALTPEDAFAVDKKMDDGVPHQGTIRAPRLTSWQSTCIEDPGDNAYRISNKNVACTLQVMTGY